MRLSPLPLVVVMLSSLSAQSGEYPVPRFTDPNRPTTLARAYVTIRARMTQLREELHAPGLSWGVVVDGRLEASGGIGVTRMPDGPPVNEHTVFRIASMTKSFTALAILKLRDEGRLSLDDGAGKYVPELARMRLPTKDAPAITVRHLLTHSAGFPEDNPWGDRQLAQPATTLHAWVARGLPFSTSPGTAYEYSNYGFALLGQVVAKASGLPYREYVTTRILQPLGMTSTYWDERDVPAVRLARGHRYVDDNWQDEPLLADGSFGAMGGLFTSGRDLARYIAFMLSAWPPRDDEDSGPVRRSSVREMQQGQRLIGLAVTRPTPDAPLAAAMRSYGYGLNELHDCGARTTITHGGGLPGFGSTMMWMPEHGVGVYALANVTYAGAGRAGRAMLDELAATGGLLARETTPSPVLLKMRDTLTGLVNEWRDQRLTAVAADNLPLDRSLDERRADFTQLHAALGACRPDGPLRAENWLRGTFRLNCDRGWLDVAFTLAPTRPPAIQYLSLDEGHALEPRFRTAVESLVTAGDAAELTGLATSIDRAALTRQLRAFKSTYGACSVGDPLSGNGKTDARVSLRCERGAIDLIVHADDNGRLDRAQFVQPRDSPCVP